MNFSKIRFKKLSNSQAIAKVFKCQFCKIHAVKIRFLEW